MLLRQFKRKISSLAYLRRSSAVRHTAHHSSLVLRLLIILAVVAVIISVFAARLTPYISEMGISVVTDVISEEMYNVITEMLASGKLDYADLVTLEKDTNGNVTALVSNMALINKLQAELAAEIIRRVNEMSTTVIDVPIGNLSGWSIFAGMGPDIPVRVTSATSASAEFENQFSSAGINQTRHQIMLELSVDVNVVVPGESAAETVKAQVSIAETVIVGDVPNSYTKFG